MLAALSGLPLASVLLSDLAVAGAAAEETAPVGPTRSGAATSSPVVLADVADVPVGSAAVLDRLWPAEALTGRPEEARIARRPRPQRAALQEAPKEAAPAASPSPLRGSIRRVDPAEGARVVALTFDLCERADEASGYDGAIVDVLRQEGVPATFFAGGSWLRTHPERGLQLIADPLFQVGNHGWTHGNLRVLTGERAEQQIVWVQAEYALLRQELVARARAAGIDEAEIARIPVQPTAFRFPYGTCSAETLEMPARFGLAAIQWDVISGDAVRGQTAATVERAVLGDVRPGSIVVCHGNGRGSEPPRRCRRSSPGCGARDTGS